MIRIILFLLLIALGAAGAAWIADQTGDVVLSWPQGHGLAFWRCDALQSQVYLHL